LIYYGNQKQLEYDFVVSPGKDPSQIRLAFEGADKISVNSQDELVLNVADEEVVQQKPFIYQEVDGVRKEVQGGYVLEGNKVGFQLASYDTSKPLVIDPVLSYSSYVGGSGDDVAYTSYAFSAGEVFIAGDTTSANYPTTAGAYRTTA